MALQTGLLFTNSSPYSSKKPTGPVFWWSMAPLSTEQMLIGSREVCAPIWDKLARARQYDKKALAIYDHMEARGKPWGAVVRAVRREGLELIHEGDPAAARDKLAVVKGY